MQIVTLFSGGGGWVVNDGLNLGFLYIYSEKILQYQLHSTVLLYSTTGTIPRGAKRHDYLVVT